MSRVLRRDWAGLPTPLVREVERRLGGAVRGFEERQGGFSGGVLGVAVLDGGGRVFVKAVPGEAEHYRWEAVVSAALPPGVPAPRFLFLCEEAGWTLLCSEVAPGRVPHEPWRTEELSAALDLLTVCAKELTPATRCCISTRVSTTCSSTRTAPPAWWTGAGPARVRCERSRLATLAWLSGRWA